MMNRREFLRLAGLAGLAVSTPYVGSAQTQSTYTGPFWIMIHASGGWDPTSLCDPKGKKTDSDTNPLNRYFSHEIGTVGPFRYAPVENHKIFFEKYASQLLVINGVDVGTNSHTNGTRTTWSGRGPGMYPALAAMIAAAHGPERPMSFITNGGYDRSVGLVAPTRGRDRSKIQEVAYHNRRWVNNPDNLYHTDETEVLINQTLNARHQSQLELASLPSEKAARSTLFLARSEDQQLRNLDQYLNVSDLSNNSLYRQAKMGLAAFRANLAISMTVNYGGFDTHSNHDSRHFPRLRIVLEGIDWILQEAERQQVADRVILVVGSDFGRTPGYNRNNGKDHWPITSMMMMGPGIAGNRVVGLTDDRHRVVNINPTTLQPDATGGKRIKAEDVHSFLRKLAGIENHPGSLLYPLETSEFSDFVTSSDLQTPQPMPPSPS